MIQKRPRKRLSPRRSPKGELSERALWKPLLLILLFSFGLPASATLNEVPGGCPALAASVGGGKNIRTFRGEYSFVRAPFSFNADGQLLASELAPKLPEVDELALATIIARAIENGFQHGRPERGHGYIEVGVVEEVETISVYVLNPLYSWGLSPKLTQRIFRPGDDVEVDISERDTSRGGHGIAMTYTFASLSRLFYRNNSSTITWEEQHLNVKGIPHSRWVRFTLTLPRKKENAPALEPSN